MTPLTPSARLGNTTFPTAVALLCLRLALGFAFIFHGWQLISQVGPQNFSGMLHLPVLPPIVWAYLAIYGQFLGGIAVLLGLLTRLATIPLIINMLVAIALVHAPNGYALMSDMAHPEKVGYEYNIALIAMATALLIAGPGLLSLDALIFRRSLLACGPQPLATPTSTRTAI